MAGRVVAQTTNIWANSNVSNTPSTSDWFTGGSNPQGTWIGGDPVGADDTTIQFFEGTGTALPHTVTVAHTANLNNSGLAFKLGALTLSGRYPNVGNITLTMNITGDALNFSGTNGTVNLDAVAFPANARRITYNVGNNIQLGTVSTASDLTITGDGSLSTYTFTGNITELQPAGGSSLVKSGSSIIKVSGNVTVSGGLEVNAGTLLLTGGANAVSGGIVLNGGTLGDNSGTISGVTLSTNTITVNGNASMGCAGGTTVSGAVTLNSGSLSVGSNNSSVSFDNTITGTGGVDVIHLGGGSSTINLNSTSNTFTGPITMNAGLNGTLNFNSLGDAVGAGNISFARVADGRTHAFNFTGSAPLTLNYRQFEIAAGGTRVDQIRNQSTNAFTIASDLSVTTTGTRTIQLGGTGTGLSTFAGNISNGSADSLGVTKIESGTWVFSGNNTYTGTTTVSLGTLVLKGSSALPDEGTLNIVSGKVQLDDREAVGALLFDGTNQLSGTWGALGSGADHIDDIRFSGSARLYVGGFPPAGTVLLIK